MRHLLFLCVMTIFWARALYAAPLVVTSIKPLHSLVSGVMEGVGKPQLLVPEGASSHHYQLMPSSVQILNKAELVFWIGPSYETFLIKALDNLRPSVTQIALMVSPRVHLRLQREGALWETDHDHHDHDHEDHEQASFETMDPHFWLDPQNAISMVHAITTILCEKDPANADRYAKNAEHLEQRLIDLDKSLKSILLGVRSRPFLVFHDGLQYFEKRYQLEGRGAIVLNPEVPPSAKRLKLLRERLKNDHIVCILREPEFNAAILENLAEGFSVKQSQIDTLAVFVPRGQEAYFSMMRQLGNSIQKCLSP